MLRSAPQPAVRRRRPQLVSGLVATALALGVSAWAQAQLPREEKATLAVDADRTAYLPGDEVSLIASMEIESGWHANSNEPTYEYLIATEIEVVAPEGWPAATIAYPPGEMKSFAFAEELISVYDGQVVMVVTQPVPESAEHGDTSVEVQLTYQACDDRSCLPPVTATEHVDVRIGEGGEPSAAAIGMAPSSDSPAPTSSPALAWMLLAGVLGGLILNAMPCVLPVLSLKVFGLVKSAGQGRAQVVSGALATTAGILISFWALALLAIVAKSGGAAVGWGVQFQEPGFVAALAIVVVLFCLNLWGLFEVRLPARLGSAAGSGAGEGMAGHFSSGLFATLMATPCSAPFLGTAIGFGLSQSAPTILAIFTAVAVGMSLPYLMLAAAPGAAKLLPKPGPWMNHLRIVMGFLLAGAAVWLLYVLSAQISAERLAFFQISLLVMALAVWWRGIARRRTVRSGALLAITVSIVGGLVLATGGESASSRTLEETRALIDWAPFDRADAERLKSDGRLVFVDVTADWCFTCKVNERLALETDEVAGVFARHGVVPMKADWTNRSDEIADFLADHGRYGIPFYLLYRPSREPHLFGELITTQEIVRVVEEAGGELAASSMSSF